MSCWRSVRRRAQFIPSHSKVGARAGFPRAEQPRLPAPRLLVSISFGWSSVKWNCSPLGVIQSVTVPTGAEEAFPCALGAPAGNAARGRPSPPHVPSPSTRLLGYFYIPEVCSGVCISAVALPSFNLKLQELFEMCIFHKLAWIVWNFFCYLYVQLK